MQTTAYTITPHEAEVFRDLVTFLDEYVFDQRRGDCESAPNCNPTQSFR
jgi:uncharacterized protein (DUF779 family)